MTRTLIFGSPMNLALKESLDPEGVGTKKGKRPEQQKNGDHLRMNVIGMVCPRTGQFFAIEASHSDTELFQAFLDEANKTVKFQRAKNILIMDNASWHKRKSLRWQDL